MTSDILRFTAYSLNYKIVHERNVYYLYLVGPKEDTLLTKCWHSTDILKAAFNVQMGDPLPDDDITEELPPRDVPLVPPSGYPFDVTFPEPETELVGHCAPSPWVLAGLELKV